MEIVKSHKKVFFCSLSLHKSKLMTTAVLSAIAIFKMSCYRYNYRQQKVVFWTSVRHKHLWRRCHFAVPGDREDNSMLDFMRQEETMCPVVEMVPLQQQKAVSKLVFWQTEEAISGGHTDWIWLRTQGRAEVVTCQSQHSHARPCCIYLIWVGL